MGFLSKLGIGHKTEEDDIPPPPPLPGTPDRAPVQTKDVGPQAKPPKLDEPSMPPPAPPPKSMPPPMPAAPKEASPKIPPAKIPAQSMPPKPDMKAPSAPPQASKPARADVRKAFSDIPPITVSAERKATITNDQAKEFDVDKFVLPEHEVQRDMPKPIPPRQSSTASVQQSSAPRSAAPLPMHPRPQRPLPPDASHSVLDHESPFQSRPPARPSSPTTQHVEPPAEPHQSGFAGPLYVNVDTYQGIQKALKDLDKQITDVSADMEDIKRLTNDEDKQFSVIVSKLEKIQDDILTIDQDLFEEK